MNKSAISIELPSPEYAYMLQSVLEVDEELQPTKISKSFAVDGNNLIV